MSVGLAMMNVKQNRSDEFFEFKATLLQNHQDLSDGLLEGDIEVEPCYILLQYSDDFVDADFVHSKNYQVHKDILKNHYQTQNQEFIQYLNFNYPLNSDWIVSFDYGSFIQLNYRSDNDLIQRDIQLLVDDGVYAAGADYETDFSDELSGYTKNEESYHEIYDYSYALEDIGLKSEYTGKGIKIGSIESGIPDNYINLQNTTYFTYGTHRDKHCTMTASVYGGDYGIAKNSTLYFVADPDTTALVEGTAWLIDNGVDIINQSSGYKESGNYDAYSAFEDYVAYNFGILYVVSSGNNEESNLAIDTSAMGANVLCVGASSANYGVWYKSSYRKSKSKFVKAKPNLVAPGDRIYGVQNQSLIHYSDPVSGTSISAPFVTGVSALLMEEFPSLRKHPEKMISLLQASTTKALNQTTEYDDIAGFGIVNYRNAREIFENLSSFNTTSGYQSGDIIYKTDVISVKPGETLSVNAVLLEPSSQTDPKSTMNLPDFESMKAVLVNDTFPLERLNGKVLGNTSYLSFSKENDSDKISTFRIFLIANDAWVAGADMNMSVSYRITSDI